MTSKTLTLFLFLLADLQQTVLMNLKAVLRKEGFGIQSQFERKYEKSIKDVKSVLKDTKVMGLDDQERFGDVADELFDLMVAVVVKTSGHPDKIKELTKLISEK